MPRVITDTCTDCGECEGICPNDAIVPGDGKYEILASHCVDCGKCDDMCIVEAIVTGMP